MEQVLNQISHIQMLDQLFITFLLILPIILIARTIVSGTNYSPTLIIVIFGLLMGFVLVKGNVATPGVNELPIVVLMSKVTIIALVASFFVGGQEIKKIFTNQKIEEDDLVEPNQDELILGTRSTQFVFIIRAFFILLGVEGITRLLLGVSASDPLQQFYPIIAYLGLAGAIILIDPKAQVKDKRVYLGKGAMELMAIILVLVLSAHIARLVGALIALPQIFFAMLLSCGIGILLPDWRLGPTLRSLLFAGIPVVLAANFIVGGSLFTQAFGISGVKAVMTYGLFGQLMWMFGGLTLLIFLAKANHVRNLGPGMAGALSHSGLTGACTAGDLGEEAASRAPIMINIPFFGHVFVFSILAASAAKGQLYFGWVAALVAVGTALTLLSVRTLRRAGGDDAQEVKGLMQFSFGFQVIAVFGSFLLLSLGGMSVNESAMATSSALSHFGLFAATQGGMFGETASLLIPLIFAMPFLIHPFVFGIFGRAMSSKGIMPAKTALVLFLIGVAGIVFSLLLI